MMGKQSSWLAVITLALLVLPHRHNRLPAKPIRAVPDRLSGREAFALGATRWQTVIRTLVLPYGLRQGYSPANDPCRLARAVGETAPLIVMGALDLRPLRPRPAR